MTCYNFGNLGHIAAKCPKGKGKVAQAPWPNAGKGNVNNWSGQWNIGAVQSGSIANPNDNASLDSSPPQWDMKLTLGELGMEL